MDEGINMNLELLKEPFPESDIVWRPQRRGLDKNGNPYAMVLAYVTNRAVMDRLDEVCGMDNWENKFEPGANGGIKCIITIHTPKGSRKKEDGAENTNVEAIKGGMSGAMKRCAVQWGIGRYLYKLPVTFAKFHDYGANNIKINNKWYKYDNPVLSKEFLPKTKGEK